MPRILWIVGDPKEVVSVSTLEALQETLTSGETSPFDLVLVHTWPNDRESLLALLKEHLPGIPVYEVGPFGYSGELFRALVENASDITYVIDEEGGIRFASPNVARVLGYDPQDHKRAVIRVLDFIHPEDRAYAEAALEDLIRHPGVTRVYQGRILDAWGRVRRVRVWGRNLLQDPVVRGIVLNVRDETEESELKERLEAERALLKGVLESLPGAVYQIQIPPGADEKAVLSGQLVYLAPQVKEVFGYPPEAFLNDPAFFFDHLHPEDRPRVEASLLAAYRNPGQAQAVTYRFQHGAKRDWSWFRNTMVYTPEADLSAFDPQGNLTVYAYDVTQEVAREEAFHFLFQAHPLPMWVYDLETLRFLEVNETATQAYGYTREEFLSMTILDIRPEGERERLLENLRDPRPTLKRSGPWVHRLKDGREILVEVHSHTLGYQGRPAVLVVALDVTERVRTERTLRESEGLFRTLTATAPALIVLWQDERLRFVNDTVLALTGYTPEEVQNRLVWDFVHPQDRELVKRWGLARLKGEEVPSRYAFRILTKEGEVRWLDYSAARVEIGGRPAVLGVGLDITEAKERERTLEAFARLSLALRGSEDLRRMMEGALDLLLEVMEAEAGSLLLYEGEPPRLVERAARGWMAELAAAPRLEEKSLVGLALKGEVVLSPHLKEDPRLREASRPLVPEGWSGMALPLTAGPRPLGVLLLAWPEGRLPTPKEVERAEVLAEALGGAIRRAQLRQRLARQVERLEALRRVDQAVLASMGLEPSLEILLNQAFLTQVDAAALFLLDPRSKTLQLKAHRGFRSTPPREIPLGQGHVGRAALFGEVVAVDDLAQDPGTHPEWTRQEGLVAEWAYPLMARGKVVGSLAFFTRRPWDLGREDEDFLRVLVGQGALALESLRTLEDLLRAQRELEAAYELTLWGWAKAVELRDQETSGHTERVTELALRLARALGVPEEDLEHIRRGAILHDVGKIAIPDRILQKPGPLTEEEWAVMKRHPVYAYEWLSGIPFLKKALEIPYSHHERWDGSGYPLGLKEQAIPFSARIFTVVDVYDALTSDRPYRKAWPREKALAYIQEEAGRQFDPEGVEAFLPLMEGGG